MVRGVGSFCDAGEGRTYAPPGARAVTRNLPANRHVDGRRDHVSAASSNCRAKGLA